MLMVLVHPHGALSPGLSRPLIQLLPRLLLSCLFCLLAASFPAANAQDPPAGLTVLASPAPNTVLKAGDFLNLAIDVNAGNSQGWAYNSVEIYIVSDRTNTNVSVAGGPQLLAQEPGSTVKHVQWPIATCLVTGDYNLTIYESTTFDGTGYFAIMPIPVQVQNDRRVDPFCSSRVNPLQTQPQPSNPPPASLIPQPFNSPGPSESVSPSEPAASGDPGATESEPAASTLDASASATPPPDSSLTSSAPEQTGGGIITVTAGDGDITIPLSELPGTIVVEPSGGLPADPSATEERTSGFITITRTVAPTATLTEVISEPVTITVEETFVSTITAPEETREITVTQTLLSTIQLVASQPASPQQAGLLPVNAAVSATPLFAVSMFWALSASTVLYVLRPVLAL
ncbi:hypothetical protein C8Q76DRAFT_791866 [Earliella scabrosa]|nr:hypothetical protein C8Q76DRAFT_791866 [Earliella scabrosa]